MYLHGDGPRHATSDDYLSGGCNGQCQRWGVLCNWRDPGQSDRERQLRRGDGDQQRAGAVSVGTNLVTWTATDNSGNTATCQQRVIVRDVQGPVITCPANIVVNAAAGQCTSNVTFTVTANDACGSVTNLTSVPASGSAFAVGVTTVTSTAKDNSGNTSTCTFTVTVHDTQLPTITCPADVTVNANAGVCFATGVVLGSPTASDNCGAVTVTSNAPAQFPWAPTW